MSLDPRLLELATQFGRLLKAYGGESLAEGHAALELAHAVQAGLKEAARVNVTLRLPLLASSEAREEFDIGATTAIELNVQPHAIEAQRLPAPPLPGYPVSGTSNDFLRMEVMKTYLWVEATDRNGRRLGNYVLSCPD